MATSTFLLTLGAGACFGALVLGASELLPTGEGPDAEADPGAATRDPGPGLRGRLASLTERILVDRGWEQAFATALARAGFAVRPGDFCLLVAVGGLLAALAIGLVAGPLLAVLAVALTPLVARVVVHHRQQVRRKAFAEQVVALLPALASSLRAGHSLIQAIELSSRELAAPAGDELRRVAAEVHLGRDTVEALEAMADRYDCEDLRWLVAAIELHREVGGDLTKVLDRVSDTIRARDHLARQVATLTAEGRASAKVLSAMPIFIVAVMAVINPTYLDTFLGTATGIALFVGAACLVVVGMFWLRVVTRVEV